MPPGDSEETPRCFFCFLNVPAVRSTEKSPMLFKGNGVRDGCRFHIIWIRLDSFLKYVFQQTANWESASFPVNGNLVVDLKLGS